MVSWSSSCYLRTLSRATLGLWGVFNSHGWTPPCMTWPHGQPRPHTAERPSTRLGKPSPVPGCVEGGGQPVRSCEQCGVIRYIQVFAFPFCMCCGGPRLLISWVLRALCWLEAWSSEWVAYYDYFCCHYYFVRFRVLGFRVLLRLVSKCEI